MRTPLVVANWKMNKTTSEAVDYLSKLKEKENLFSGVEVVICPSFVVLEKAKSLLEGSVIQLGAQNIYQEEQGAFTGEVSAAMIAPYCSYVILGHSERRKYFHETYLDVEQKIILALNHGIKPIICVGEDLEERNNNQTAEVVRTQLTQSLESLSGEQIKNIVIAYEPIWAIGTGLADQPEETNLVCHEIRQLLTELFNKETSEEVRILYGGSITQDNISSFIQMPEIDGALIGGTSLNVEAFIKIIEIVKEHYKETHG